MTFDVPAEHVLFAESVRTAIGAWEPPREPELGAWEDGRDEALAVRLAGAGAAPAARPPTRMNGARSRVGPRPS